MYERSLIYWTKYFICSDLKPKILTQEYVAEEDADEDDDEVRDEVVINKINIWG